MAYCCVCQTKSPKLWNIHGSSSFHDDYFSAMTHDTKDWSEDEGCFVAIQAEGGGCCWRRQAIPTTTHDGNIDNRLPVALNDVKDLLASIKCVLASIWHTTRNLHTLFQRLLPLLLLACTHSLTHCRVHRIIVIPAKWRAIISTVELVCLHRKFALNPHCIVSSSSSSTYTPGETIYHADSCTYARSTS